MLTVMYTLAVCDSYNFLNKVLFRLYCSVTCALEVSFNGMRYINPHFTYITYFLTSSAAS